MKLLNVDAFYADERTFDAVLMNFIIIGEATSKLSEDLKQRTTSGSLFFCRKNLGSLPVTSTRTSW